MYRCTPFRQFARAKSEAAALVLAKYVRLVAEMSRKELAAMAAVYAIFLGIAALMILGPTISDLILASRQ